MNGYISRKEAADYLGCNIQTITNYAERKFFKTLMAERCLFIEKESFEEFISSYYKEVEACDNIKQQLEDEQRKVEDDLERLREKVRVESEELEQRLALIRSAKTYAAFVNSCYPAAVLSEYLREVGVQGKDKLDGTLVLANAFDIIVDLCKGMTYDTIAEKNKISFKDLQRQTYKGMTFIRQTTGFIGEIKTENERLRKRCARQHRAIEQYRYENMLLARHVEADEQYKMSVKALAVAYAKEYLLEDHFDQLPLRARTACKNLGLVTMYDLLSVSKGTLLASKSCGWKTLDALVGLIEAFDATRPNYTYTLECFCDEDGDTRK